MAIEVTSLEYWRTGEPVVESSRTVAAGRSRVWDVRTKVREILGYDVLTEAEMIQGYQEQADLDVEIAESNLAAAFETLPPE